MGTISPDAIAPRTIQKTPKQLLRRNKPNTYKQQSSEFDYCDGLGEEGKMSPEQAEFVGRYRKGLNAQSQFWNKIIGIPDAGNLSSYSFGF
jgi:hypothetical protein